MITYILLLLPHNINQLNKRKCNCTSYISTAFTIVIIIRNAIPLITISLLIVLAQLLL